LKDKERTEYTGLESYIAEQIDNGEISWFPTHRALIMKGEAGESDESNVVMDSLKMIEEKQIQLFKYGSSVAKNISGLEELIKKFQVKRKNLSKQMSIKSGKSNQSNNTL
jgi:inositol 1,4,5-triphosphate receptor type 3